MESAFRLAPSAPRAAREYAPRYTADEWEAIKPAIQQLYVEDEKTLQQVIDTLQRDNAFAASYVLLPFPGLILKGRRG
jgi:Clr5 domain